MANELFKQFATGKTIYAVLRRQSNAQVVKVADGTSEASTSAHWAAGNYTYPLTDSTSCGLYSGDINPIPTSNETFDALIFLQAGGSAAVSDTLIGQGIFWVAGGVVGIRQVNTTQVSATAQTAGDIYGYLTTNLGALGANATALATAVWAVTTRLLSAGTNIVLAKGTGLTGLNDIAATAIVSSGAITTSGGKVSEVALVDTVTTYTGNTPQTADVALRLTSARAGYLDNLNVGGNVASHADITAINQSASKHLTLATVGQYVPGETYTIECRTYAAADGSAVNADSTPTLTATGQVSGSLSGNLSAVSNPATGVYRATYTPGATPTLEQIRIDVSATISSATFTLSAYTQTVDEASVVWTASDQSHLTSIYNKLPTGNIADETLLETLIGSPAGGSLAVALAEIEAETDGIAAIPTSPPATVTLDASQPNYTPATSAQAVAIKAKTDLIATNSGDSANAVTAQGSIATTLTDAAAIKAKTDNLPASPASTGDVTSAVTAIETALGPNVPITSDTVATVTSAILFTGTALPAGKDFTGMDLVFTSGANAKVARRISIYVIATQTITLDNSPGTTPSVADTFDILGYSA